MLTLTENAATVIEGLIANADGAADPGIRIEGKTGKASSMEVQLASEPHESDEIVEQAGARVYLDAHAAAALSDKELDAVVDENAVKFSIRSR